MKIIRRRRVVSGGAMPPRFSFLPPPRFFSCPPRYFLGGRSWCFWAEKTVEICDFGQKKSLDFVFFGNHLLLVGKFVISARKSLRISAKTFAPLILILPHRSCKAGDAFDSPYFYFHLKWILEQEAILLVFVYFDHLCINLLLC